MKYLDYLPEHLREYAELQAIGTAVDQQQELSSDRLAAVEESLYLDTIPSRIVNRWEAILGLSNDSLILVERRGEIIARLNSRAPITAEKLQLLLEQMTGCSVEISETPQSYHFDVAIYRRDTEIDVSRIQVYIDQVKPANQTYTVLVINSYLTAVTYVGGVISAGDIFTIHQV